MSSTASNKSSRIIATISFLVMAAYEIWHTFIQKVPWAGFEPEMNRVSYVLLPLFALAITGIWMKGAGMKAWLVLGLAGGFTHAIVLSATLNPGWIYFFASATAAVAAFFAHAPASWFRGKRANEASVHSLRLLSKREEKQRTGTS